MSETDVGYVALDAVMERFSDHLDTLAAHVFEVEEALGRAMGDKIGLHDPDFIQRLQSLDFLRQSLEDLALLTCHMSRHSASLQANRFLPGPALDSVKLQATKSLLTESRVHGEPRGQRPETGALDLF